MTTPTPGELPHGARIGEYEVLAVLGRGGMGVVYEALQPVIGKRVAIKVLQPSCAAEPELVARFVQEARAATHAASPQIVDVFAFGQLPDGRHYFAMEHLKGHSLTALLQQHGPLELDLVLRVLRSVALGLRDAHRVGIVHRDLKPQNIVVLDAPTHADVQAKLLDFGVAKLLDPTQRVAPTTRVGASVGTVHYMAPEQIRAEKIDHRADIYAFGVITFRMLTGKLPFTASSHVELATKHLQDTPPTVSQFRADVPPPLEGLVLRCLAKDREARPQSMDEILADLERLAAVPRAPAQPSPAARRPRRLWLLVLAVALAAGVVGGAAVGVWRLLQQPGTAAPGTAAPPASAPARRAVLARLTVKTGEPRATYAIDGAIVASGPLATLRHLSPGAHRLVVTAPGRRRLERKIALEAGGHLELDLPLAPAAAAGSARAEKRPPSERRKKRRRRRPAPPAQPSKSAKPAPRPRKPGALTGPPCNLRVGGEIRPWHLKMMMKQARLVGLTGNRVYDAAYLRRRGARPLAALTRCFARHVRCRPTRWYAEWMISVDDRGQIQRITRRSAREPQALFDCGAKVLRRIRWGPAANGTGGTFRLAYQVY